jgi:hypothetical protein
LLRRFVALRGRRNRGACEQHRAEKMNTHTPTPKVTVPP